MKPTSKNRWFKLLAWLLVLVIIVMLLIPSELTDEQLAQIKPGMQMAEVTRILGKDKAHVTVTEHSSAGTYWVLDRKWWKPLLKAKLNSEAEATINTPNSYSWYARNNLLWVEHHNGIVTKTWLFPLTRTGGGLQGCIDTIKQYWNDWWK